MRLATVLSSPLLVSARLRRLCGAASVSVFLLLLSAFALPAAAAPATKLLPAFTSSLRARALAAAPVGPRRHRHEDGLYGVPFSAVFVPQITVTKTDQIIGDDGDGLADPGETIRYTVLIKNDSLAMDATGVVYTDTFDPNTTLVPGSENASPIVFDTTATVEPGGMVTIKLTGSDGDGDNLTFSIVAGSGPSEGTLGAVTQVPPNMATVVYTNTNTLATADTFKVRVNDGTVDSNEDAFVVIAIDAPPEVSTMEPADGSMGVAVDTTLKVTFTEPVTVTGDWFEIVCTTSGTYNPTGSGGATVVTVTDSDPMFLLDPSSDFDTDEDCTVTFFAAQVTDDDTVDPPDNMPADTSFTFMTDAPPTVTNTDPDDGRTDVPVDTTITIDFSELVDVTGDWFEIVCTTSGTYNPTGSGGATVVAVTNSNPQFVLDPSSDFVLSETCTVTLDAASITDQDGGDPPDELDGNGDGVPGDDFVFSFSTPDAPPEVSLMEPADGSTNIAADSTLRVTFTEPVTVAGDWFEIDCNGTLFNPSGTGGTTVTVTDTDPVFLLDPDADLPGGETCVVTFFAAQVTDDDPVDPPDNMPADTTFTFGVAPVAVDDDYTASGNIGIEIAADGVITNDEGTGLSVSEVQGSGANVGTPTATAMGGEVTLDADGSFSYEPPPGFTGGDDTFTYRITSTAGTSNEATVTITISGIVWFIDGSDTGSNLGTFSHPFQSIGDFNTANAAGGPTDPADGHLIYLYEGTYTEGIELRDGQELYGDEVDLTTKFTQDANSLAIYDDGSNPDAVNDPASARPVIALPPMAAPKRAASATDGITLGQDNVVRSVNVTDTPNGFGIIDDGSSIGAADIDSVSVSGTGGAIRFANGGSVAAVTFDVLESTSSTAENLKLFNITGTMTISGGGSGLSGSAASSAAVNIDGTNPTTNTVGFTYPGNVSKTNGGAAVSISNHGTGTITFSGSVSATGGTGLQFSNADSPTSYNFTGTVTLNGDDAGIDILSGSSGTFTFSNSSNAITNPSGTAFNVNSGAPTVTYDGDISKTSAGRVVEVNSITGGSVTFQNGTITDTGGTGINLDSNSAGMVNFNSDVDITNPSAAGVTLDSNTGGTFTFADLDIDNSTSNQKGIETTGTNTGATLNVTTGTIDAGDNSAVDLDNIALGVNLVSVDSDGGTAPGIDLRSTTGSFTVDGDGTNTSDGGNASGGTIANKTGANGASNGVGVFLDDVTNVTLRRLQLNDFSNFAIRGTSVTGFDLEYSTIDGTNGNSAADDEGSVSFENLLDTANFTNTVISGGHEDNLVVINDTGTLDRLTVSGGTIGLNATTTGNDGISVEARMSATLNVSVLGVSFLGARGDMVQCNVVDTATMDCVLRDNTFANGHSNIVPGGGGITISGGGATADITMTYEVSGTTPGAQTFTGAKGFAITANYVSGTGTVSGLIRNNYIGTPGVPGSGSTEGGGILAGAAGTVEHTVTIDANRVRRIGLGGGTASGIDIVANIDNPGGPRPEMNATITSNDVAELEGVGGFAGLNLTVAGAGTENGILNLDVRSNTFDASGGSTAGNAVFMSQFNAASNFNFFSSGVGYSGSPNGEFAFACAAGTASVDLGAYLVARGNTMINGPFPFPAGTGVSALTVCGVTGTSFMAAPVNIGHNGGLDREPGGWRASVEGSREAAASPPVQPRPAPRPYARTLRAEPVLLASSGNDLDALALLPEDPGLPTLADFEAAFPKPSHAAGPVVSGEAIMLTIGTLPAGKSITIAFDVTVDDPLPAGVDEVCNQGTVTADGGISVLTGDPDETGPGDPDDATCTLVEAAPDLTLAKDDGGASVMPGGTVAYTLTYENVGNQDATGVELTETVPANTTFNAGASTPGWVCLPDGTAGSICTLAVGGVAAGAGTATATFAVTVVNSVPAGTVEIANTASIADDGTNGADPTPGDNEAGDTTPVEAMPDVTATKVDLFLDDGNNDGVANPGETIRYTIVLTNNGDEDGTGVVFTDAAADHPNTTLVDGSVTTTQGTVTSGNGGGPDTDVVVNVGALPGGGGSVTITFEVTIDDPFPMGSTEVCNQGTVTDNFPDTVTDDPDDPTSGADPTCTPVVSNQPPVADAGPDQTVECTDPGGTAVTLDGSGSSDPDGDPLTFTWTGPFPEGGGTATGPTPTVTLPLGTHTISLTVEDGRGGSDTDEVEITVEDTTPPVITVAAAPLVLWPPNHKYHSIALSQIVTGATDACDEDVSADDVVIHSVSSDEPEDAAGGGDGHTTGDIVIGGSCQSVDVRAERQGGGNGRVYTIHLAVTDASGNTGTATFQVQVPHDRKDTAVDDGPDFVVDSVCGSSAVPRLSSGGETPRDEAFVDEAAERPEAYALSAVYPNPFNPSTQISFALPEAAPVLLTVYDVRGREVARLVDGPMPAGRHQVTFRADGLPSGLYLYRIQAGAFVQVRRMVLVK